MAEERIKALENRLDSFSERMEILFRGIKAKVDTLEGGAPTQPILPSTQESVKDAEKAGEDLTAPTEAVDMDQLMDAVPDDLKPLVHIITPALIKTGQRLATIEQILTPIANQFYGTNQPNPTSTVAPTGQSKGAVAELMAGLRSLGINPAQFIRPRESTLDTLLLSMAKRNIFEGMAFDRVIRRRFVGAMGSEALAEFNKALDDMFPKDETK